MSKQYIPLHVHSDFSVSDSILSIDEYVNWAKENLISSIALTDHGSLSGAMYFDQQCLLNGIKPIIGIEAYCMFQNEFKTEWKRDHLIIIAKNKQGYKDLLKLLGKSMRESYYYKPVIFYEDLFKYVGNLIVLTACTAGRVQKLIIAGEESRAKDFVNLMKNEFKDDFYLEVMENDIKEQRLYNEWVFKNHSKFKIEYIWTTDSHYLKPTHNTSHDILKLNLQKLSFLDTGYKDRIYTSRHLYLKTREEVIEETKTKGYNIDLVKECLDNTFVIDSKCEKYELKSKEVFMPRFSDNSYKVLCDKVKKALIEKKLEKKAYVERVKHELNVIKLKKMEDYFLIVADICDFARENNVFCGIGRGSGGGSLVVYLLGITKIDPIKYNLLFERMLNVQRVDPPDIDLDFDSRGRYKIEEYLKQKYGFNSVSHIISFSKFGVKGALRDTFRVYHKMKYKEDLEKCTKNIDVEEEDFDKALKASESIGGEFVKKFFNQHRDEIEKARVLVGKNRHYTLHAGGVVISKGDLENYIPIMRIDDNIAAGFQEGADNRLITDAGLMKFDILGLNACSIIHDVLEMLKGKITLNDIIADDNNKEVIKQFQEGNTFGVFQFEGNKITEFIKRVHPENFEDLVAINALYRPAVITAGGLDIYIKNAIRFDKDTKDPFERVLKETYGVPVYQEQIMQIFHELGGLTLEEADEARHILKLLFKGKEDYTDFNKLMEHFKEGCRKNTDYSDEKIEEKMEIVKQFSQYSFNRSHSCAYAMMGYAMQYLKILYPHEFFSALLSNTDNSDSVQDRIQVNMLRNYIIEIQNRTKIRIVRPDINESDASKFKIEGDNLLFPLGKIKGVGDKGIIELIEKRPYDTFADFIKKVEKRKCNKRVISALIKSGAMKFADAIEGYKKIYKEDVTSVSPINSFETTNILFGDEFKFLFPNYHMRLKNISGKKIEGIPIYAFIYKLRPVVSKSGRKRNFISLYDGSEILDNCIVDSFEGLEEGKVISCKLRTKPSYAGTYDNLLYGLDEPKMVEV
jgi:DNA polymerase-3 subunit alpha